MKMSQRLLAFFVGLFVIVPTIAFAQEAAEVHATGVDLRPLLQEVLLTLGSVAVMLALWGLRMVGTFIRTKTGVNVLEQEALMRKYIEAALQSGLKYASTQVDKADWAHVDTKNEMLNVAAEYALNSVPDALKYFKIDREALMEKLKARLPDLELTLAQTAAATATVAAPAAKAPARAR